MPTTFAWWGDWELYHWEGGGVCAIDASKDTVIRFRDTWKGPWMHPTTEWVRQRRYANVPQTTIDDLLAAAKLFAPEKP